MNLTQISQFWIFFLISVDISDRQMVSLFVTSIPSIPNDDIFSIISFLRQNEINISVVSEYSLGWQLIFVFVQYYS